MSHERQQISSRSINSIIRAHPRERLLVRPPLWTSRHLELLNVEWKPPQKCETDHDHAEPIAPSPLSPSSGNDGGPRLTKGRVDVRSLADQAMRLATTIYGGVKDWTIINLLNNMDNPGHLDRENLKFRFAGRVVDQVPCLVFSAQVANTTTKSRIAYLDCSQVASQRRQQFQPRFDPNGASNAPCGRLMRTQVARLTPVLWYQDPYFVSILIALAQYQEKARHGGRSRTKSQAPRETLTHPESYLTHLLVTSSEEKEFIYVLEAAIPQSILSGFKTPDQCNGVDAGVVIKCSKIPFKPYITFSDRLERNLFETNASSCYMSSGTAPEMLKRSKSPEIEGFDRETQATTNKRKYRDSGEREEPVKHIKLEAI